MWFLITSVWKDSVDQDTWFIIWSWKQIWQDILYHRICCANLRKYFTSLSFSALNYKMKI